MMVFFELTVGIGNRTWVRRALGNSKAKIEHWYPGSRVLMTESKSLLESVFYFEADGLPASAEREWLDRLKAAGGD